MRLSFVFSYGPIVSRPFAGITKLVKLLEVCPLSVADSGFPSGVNKSRRTVRLLDVVLATIISVVQPLPVTNWGNRTDPSPPTPNEVTGIGVFDGDRSVTGIVL